MQLWVITEGESQKKLQTTEGELQKKLPTASYQNSLAYHSSAVNVLRFSPPGKNILIF